MKFLILLGFFFLIENISTHKFNLSLEVEFSTPDNENFDWRDQGAVTPVKKQLGCESCYAFAAVETIETQYFLKTGHLRPLSAQQVVDCSKSFGNHGCKDGTIEKAFASIKKHGGVMAEDLYPYTGHDDKCSFRRSKATVTIRGYKQIPASEIALMNAVKKVGPVAAMMDFTQSLRIYKSGIYSEHDCESDVKQSVLIVGYGKVKGVEYWIIKNSWVIKKKN